MNPGDLAFTHVCGTYVRQAGEWETAAQHYETRRASFEKVIKLIIVEPYTNVFRDYLLCVVIPFLIRDSLAFAYTRECVWHYASLKSYNQTRNRDLKLLGSIFWWKSEQIKERFLCLPDNCSEVSLSLTSACLLLELSNPRIPTSLSLFFFCLSRIASDETFMSVAATWNSNQDHSFCVFAEKRTRTNSEKNWIKKLNVGGVFASNRAAL